MEYSTFLIVCPLVFLAGFVDAIGGGGGLISLPAYILAGVPMHAAVATNKLSSATGTLISTIRLCLHSKVDFLLAVPAIFLAYMGSSMGARLSMLIQESVLKAVLLVILPITAFFVIRKDALSSGTEGSCSRRRQLIIAWMAAVLIGLYDGFYGPGTGTFYIIIFMSFAKMTTMEAAVNTKLLNLTSNLAALVTFLLHGQVWIMLGLAASVFSIAGHYLGAGMVLKNGSRVVRPIILVVLCLLFIKVLSGI
ncbi:MAG: TSUP family transporter [Anaerostipes sp.]|nr:TSUP family transporter [Anaerostipes sp.]MDD5969298.1 TSUP family transporter [Anaerostipes sp.]